MKKMRKYWIERLLAAGLLATVLAAVLALCGGCIKEGDEPVWSLGAGDPVPDFTVTLADGTPWHSTTQLRGHKGVIVFFNTDCADCRRELPHLQTLWETEYAETDPDAFICIAREQDAAEIAAYWTEHSLTMPYAPQSDRSVYSLFATSWIPRIYLTNPDLTISAALTTYP